MVRGVVLSELKLIEIKMALKRLLLLLLLLLLFILDVVTEGGCDL